jgi:ribosomal protein S6
MLADYEITYLTDAGLSEEARGALDTAVDTEISEAEGSIGYSSPHIRRRIFYPIKKKPAAFARTIQVQLDSQAIDTLKASLKKKEGVLRVMILNTPRREEVSVEMLSQSEEERKEKAATPAKKVTMEEVEEKIEEALQQEVK